jgi:hypothetical protein
MDPLIQIRIRIHTKMSWIRNTVKNRYIGNFMFIVSVFCILCSNGPPFPSCMGGGELETLCTRSPYPLHPYRPLYGTRSNKEINSDLEIA